MTFLENLSFLDVRTVILFVSLLLALRWFFGRSKRDLPPGPWQVPVIGSIPAIALGMMKGSEPHQLFSRYADMYGPVIRLKVLNTTVVVFNDYTSVREAFQHPQLNDRPKMILTELMRSEGVAMASGELWVELRRFCLTVLRSFGVGKSSFEEKIGAEGEELVKEMVAFDRKPFKPKNLLSIATSNIICSVIFGKRYDYKDQEFDKLLTLLGRNFKLLGSGGAINFLPILRHVPFLPLDEIASNFDEIRLFLTKIIDGHRDLFDGVNMSDFTDVFLMEISKNQAKAAAGVTPSYISECTFVGTVTNLFAAGSETVATTLHWCILYMIVYPDIQKRVQDEIDEVVGRNRLPRLADKPELNFTRAVIWEVQRLSSVVPLGIPHAAASDITFRGFLIPKGAILLPNLWAINRDPNLWQDPDQFKPERFLNDKGEAVQADELIPFSTGRRSCIGEHLAKMELFVFFTYFLHQFTFKKPDNSPPLSLKGRGGVSHSAEDFDACAIKRD